MKNTYAVQIILAIISSSILSACAAGSNADATPNVQASSIQTSSLFHVSASGTNSFDVEGEGINDKEAAYDATAGLITNKFKAGTQEYRDMMSEKGLVLLLWKQGSKETYQATVKLMKDGKPYIDVVVLMVA